jgi:hypothetical protein
LQYNSYTGKHLCMFSFHQEGSEKSNNCMKDKPQFRVKFEFS